MPRQEILRGAQLPLVNLRQFRARIPHWEDWPHDDGPVFDGDTARFELDLNLDHRAIMDCRLEKVFAPETTKHEPGSTEARTFVLDWLRETATDVSWPWWVDTIRTRDDSRERTTLGRYITQVWNQKRTRNLNVEVQAYISANGWGGGTGAA